ncbi:MAG: hypothetical protein ACO1OT_13730 [Heyndrickxia sp.]
MYEELNMELVQMKGDIRKKQLWEKQVEEYHKELTDIRNTIAYLEDEIYKDNKDIQKLETLSLTNLLVTLAGNKEDRLDKDKQNVIKAQIKLDTAKKSLNDIVHALETLKIKLTSVQDSEDRYEKILWEKEQLIINSYSPYSNELYELSNREADIFVYIDELKEALEAGEKVNFALGNAIQSLEKAENWGTFDMLGGGVLASSVKHNHLDDARDYVHDAQSKMRRFQKELLDVNEITGLQIEISSMLKFADFFFDGLIVDWMVQGKIRESLQQAEVQQSKLNNILAELKSQLKENETKLESVKEARKELVERL